jgi:hypothetical protein
MNTNENSQNMMTVNTTYSIMPQNLEAQINDAINMRNALTRLFEAMLVKGIDYDRIPGTDRPTLLKPGAEMICKIFKLGQGKADVLGKNEDWEAGIFSYTIGMPLIHLDSGAQVAYGIGAANSKEKRYRYRNLTVDGKKMQIENPDPADLQNTLIKMANKRAFVDAILKATGASRMFTQDSEDFAALSGQLEAASTKQLGLIKSMYKNKLDDVTFTEISDICGREINSYGDILRSEASIIIDVKKSGSGTTAARKSAAPKGAAAKLPENTGNGRNDVGYTSEPYMSQKNEGALISNNGINLCSDCGVAITVAESVFSQSRYGRGLCRSCQTAARSA